MKSSAPILIPALVHGALLAGCARTGPAETNNVAAAPAHAAPLPPPAPGDEPLPPENAAATTNGSLPEGPIDPNSGQGAAQVLQTYFALVEQGNYREAHRLWGNEGDASGMDESSFVASFGAYEAYHAEIGAPGEPEGAAGSSYVEVPVMIYGRRGGQPFRTPGSVTLRRVNDVPGSSPAQRRWHIERIQLRQQA